MNPFAAFLDPAGDVALVDDFLACLRHPVLQKLEVGLADLGERAAQPTVGVCFLEIVNLQSQGLAEELEKLVEIPDGDADVVDFVDVHATSGEMSNEQRGLSETENEKTRTQSSLLDVVQRKHRPPDFLEGQAREHL